MEGAVWAGERVANLLAFAQFGPPRAGSAVNTYMQESGTTEWTDLVGEWGHTVNLTGDPAPRNCPVQTVSLVLKVRDLLADTRFVGRERSTVRLTLSAYLYMSYLTVHDTPRRRHGGVGCEDCLLQKFVMLWFRTTRVG